MPLYEKISNEFENQYAVVTGGSSGIGYQIAKFLLYRGLEKVVILDKVVAQDSCRRLIGEFGKESVMLVGCDVMAPSDMENAFKNIIEQCKKIDILINNAGILDDRAWEKEIATNMAGTIRATLLAMKYMSKTEGGWGGTIINTSSVSGLRPAAGCPIYSAASAGIIAFTNSFAKPYHYATSGIRMMNLCPGVTYTRIISGASKKMLSDEIGKEWLKELSTTATQKPECVAQGVIHMLLNGKNGSTWISEGGKSIFELGGSPGPLISSDSIRTL